MKDETMAIRQPEEQDDFASEPHSVDLRDYWSVIRRRWRLIVLVAVLGGLAGAGYSALRGPSYTATAQVVVQPVSQGPLNQTTQASSQVNMSTEQAIAQSGPVIQQAAATLGVPASKLQQAATSRLSVTVPASTLTTSNVLQIAWQASSTLSAQQGADAFANAYLSYRHHELAGQIAALQRTLQRQVSSLRTQISQLSAQLAGSVSQTTRQLLNMRLNELSGQASTASTQLAALPTYNDSGGSVIPAVLDAKPSGFGRSVLVGIGLVLGLLIGLAIAFARDLSDDRVRDEAQLERQLGAPVLAVMPSAEVTAGAGRSRAVLPSTALAVATGPDGHAAAAARVLRATVVAIASRCHLRTLVMVAADATVPAGLVIAELGLALAESGRRVLLVASDTQGSVLPDIFGLAGEPGLIELLAQDGDPHAYTRQAERAFGVRLPAAIAERLAVLPSGRAPQHPISALDSGQMVRALCAQREAYDFILLDAPPAAGADILSLASQVDGTIVLARQARTRDRDLLALRHQLLPVQATLVGGVLIRKVRSRRAQHRSVPVEPAAAHRAADPTGPASPHLTGLAPGSSPLPLAPDGMASPVARGSGLERPR
jgi:polysaccharide biosynthesis transport protein